jgi:hypothetical protein
MKRTSKLILTKNEMEAYATGLRSAGLDEAGVKKILAENAVFKTRKIKK